MVIVDYVGYQGHFCCKCNYHLTTIVRNEKRAVIVSTVGRMYDELERKVIPICDGRLFETEVLEASLTDLGFYEHNGTHLDGQYYVSKEVFQKNCSGTLTDTFLLSEFNRLEKEADKSHKEFVQKWKDKLDGNME